MTYPIEDENLFDHFIYKWAKYIDEKDHNATIKLFFIVLALYLVMLSRVELGYISSGLNVSNKIRTT